MPYIGKSPSAGVRQRYQYTATAGQTTFSGTDLGNLTLTYTDNNFVDVFQNGVLLKGGGTDYTATSGTSVVLATGASVSDVIEIIVYDVFSVGNFFNRTDSDSRYALKEGGVVFNETSADVDFRVESNGDTHALFVDAGNDKVGVGTSSPNAKLAVSGTGTVDLGIGSTNAGGAYLYLDGDSNGDFSGSDYSYIGHDNSGQLLIHQDSPSGSDNILLKTNGSTRWTLNSSGNLFPASTSQGIVLGATSDTAANRLDDYEEGTWTPTFPAGGTVGTIYQAEYTKIGRMVYVGAYFVVSAITNNSSTFVIGGLPFTVKASNYHGAGSITYTKDFSWDSTGAFQAPTPQQGNTQVYFHRSDGTAATVLQNAVQGLVSKEFIFATVYLT